MNLVLTVLEIVAPVFLLGSIGYFWIRLGFEFRVDFVTRMATTLAVPCLIFTGLMKAQISAASLTAVVLAAGVGYLAIGGITALVVWMVGLERRTYLAPMIFGNTGNLGLPLALFAFQDQGLGYGLVIFAVSTIATFTIGVWLVAGGGSPMTVFREPLVAATLLGVLFLSMGWRTPEFLTNTLELVGQMAIPLMLLTLGVAVARLHPARLGRAVWISFLRLAICISVAVATARWFALDPVAFAVLVVQFSTPVAVTCFVLAEKYGADSQAVAGLVVVSTVISVVTLPITLALVI